MIQAQKPHPFDVRVRLKKGAQKRHNNVRSADFSTPLLCSRPVSDQRIHVLLSRFSGFSLGRPIKLSLIKKRSAYSLLQFNL
jgi:hypothetical protein